MTVLNNNNKIIRIKPGTQQVISFDVRNTLPAALTPDYGLSVQAVDPVTARIFSSLYLQVLLLGSNKRMALGNDMTASLINNSAQLSYWYTNLGYDYAQLNLNGNIGTSGYGRLKYNFNLNEYTRPIHGTDIYDSHIEYQDKFIGLQAGTITDNLDYSIYGNGVKASAFLDSSTTVSAYYVNNRYYLYSSINHQPSTGNVWAASYDFHPSRDKNIRINYLHGTDSLTGVQTDLMNVKINLLTNSKQNFEIEGGVSREHLDTIKEMAKNGISAGIHYRNNGQLWNIVSDNYISSHYYSGFRRGTTLLDERVTHQLNSHNSIYLHYQLSDNAPGYLNSSYYAYAVNTQSSIYEAGYTYALGRLNISLRPYFFTQGLRENYNGDFLSIHSQSWHGATDIAYHINQNMFTLSADAGRTNSDNPYLQHSSYNTLTARFNYNYKFAGFNASMQYNPYYIIQESTPWQPGNFRQYSLGPDISFRGFNGRLDVRASDYLNFYSYTAGYSNSVQAQANYRIGRTLSASAYVSYNTYQQYSQNRYFQSRVSLTKSFLQTNAPGYKKLTLIFYGDENANGTQDANERIIPNVIVEVNNSMTVTNRKGEVVYTNLKAGNYAIHVQEADGWYMLDTASALLLRNQRLAIGLVRTATVTGKVAGKENPYLQQAPNVEGVTIIATDNDGKTYTTLTDASGNFRMDLPIKSFTFSVETKGHDFTIDGQQQKITVQQQKNPEILFYLTDQSRRVDIKQF